MDRRDFVRSLALAGSGLLAAGSAGVRAATRAPAPRVVVIGAGIIGTAIAWRLAERGCKLTLVEAHAPAAKASGHSFAWINGGDADQPAAYQQLRALALAEHRQVGREIGLPLHWGGCLEWSADEDALVRGAQRMQALGAPERVIDAAEAARIEPALRPVGARRLVFRAADGGLDATAATHRFLARAQALGARLLTGAAVSGIETRGGGFRVHAGGERLDADRVVIAAGVGTPALAALLGIRLDQQPEPGIILRTRPLPRLLNTVLWGPATHLHQLDDGRLVVGEEGGPPAGEAHRARLAGMPGEFPAAAIAAAHAERMLTAARAAVPALAGAEVESIGIGWRPMPADGLPVVGGTPRAPGVYFAFTHSGATLSALLGRFAATEIVDGIEVAPLAAFRIDRFMTG